VWFKENAYRTNITKKEWAKSNPQKVKESSAKCYKKHKREYQKKNRDYSRSHPEVSKAAKAKRRTRIAKGGGSFSAKQWLNLCNSYNNKCSRCNKRKRLEADHVIPVTKGGSSDISNIQPLCRSCNASKGTKTIDYRKQPESSAKRGGKN
jgi:5-methylcytosine-specific restriction endonuclease McrA